MKHLKTFENFDNNPITIGLENYTQPLLIVGGSGSVKLSTIEDALKDIDLDYQTIDCSKLTKNPSSLIFAKDLVIFDNVDKVDRNVIPHILKYAFTENESLYIIFTCSSASNLPKMLTNKCTWTMH